MRSGIAVAALTLLASVLAVTALSRPGVAASRTPVPWATLAVTETGVNGGVYVVGNGQRRRVAAGASEPTWSPDGRRLAFVAAGRGGSNELYVSDADGSNAAQITWTESADETSPSWSPDGDELVVERNGKIVVVRADGARERALAAGWEPAWSPRGSRIAFSDGTDLYAVSASGRPRLARLTATPAAESTPAWAPDGRRIVFVSDESGAADVHLLDIRSGRVTRLTADAALEGSPAFAADGRSVLFVSDRTGLETLWRIPAAGRALPVPLLATPFSDPAPRSRPETVELAPDLDQQHPSDLDVRKSGRRFRLWFTAAADNVGLGPLIVNGRRARPGAPMRANQRVRLSNGKLRTNRDIGVWHYNRSSDHVHWHLLHFQRYELRRPDGAVVVRDRKSGFCIGDRYGVAPGRVAGRTPEPVFRGFCNLYQPGALRVDGGTSVGYSDRYHSGLDGQNLDITRVPAGEYVLVHRVNVDLRIHEFRYENNAASVRIRIAWPRGPRNEPKVRVLRTCPDSPRC